MNRPKSGAPLTANMFMYWSSSYSSDQRCFSYSFIFTLHHGRCLPAPASDRARLPRRHKVNGGIAGILAGTLAGVSSSAMVVPLPAAGEAS